METEPVVASEPVFSAPPCIQVPAAIVPNGSSSGGAALAKGGKVTAEQLAAVEDEELLDKMVLQHAERLAPSLFSCSSSSSRSSSSSTDSVSH